jgi:hypothetical protein
VHYVWAHVRSVRQGLPQVRCESGRLIPDMVPSQFPASKLYRCGLCMPQHSRSSFCPRPGSAYVTFAVSVIVAVLFFRMGGVTTSATVELRTWISRHVTLLCIASAACLCLYVGVYVCARICDLHIIVAVCRFAFVANLFLRLGLVDENSFADLFNMLRQSTQ